MGWLSLSGLSQPPFLSWASRVEPTVQSILELDRWRVDRRTRRQAHRRFDDDIRWWAHA